VRQADGFIKRFIVLHDEESPMKRQRNFDEATKTGRGESSHEMSLLVHSKNSKNHQKIQFEPSKLVFYDQIENSNSAPARDQKAENYSPKKPKRKSGGRNKHQRVREMRMIETCTGEHRNIPGE
jgi:hypothetical protein